MMNERGSDVAILPQSNWELHDEEQRPRKLFLVWLCSSAVLTAVLFWGTPWLVSLARELSAFSSASPAAPVAAAPSTTAARLSEFARAMTVHLHWIVLSPLLLSIFAFVDANDAPYRRIIAWHILLAILLTPAMHALV